MLIFVRDYLSRARPWVQIAKAAITGEYVTQVVARLECGVLAVPVHTALSDINYCAPRGIATRSAGLRIPKHIPQIVIGHPVAEQYRHHALRISSGSLAMLAAIRRVRVLWSSCPMIWCSCCGTINSRLGDRCEKVAPINKVYWCRLFARGTANKDNCDLDHCRGGGLSQIRGGDNLYNQGGR
jgi:hypothetical protein